MWKVLHRRSKNEWWYLLESHKDESAARLRASKYATDHGGYTIVVRKDELEFIIPANGD